MSELNVPDNLDLYTPDEVAETVDGINADTYRELWNVLNEPAFNKRPLGGDGSNGTIEVPDDFSGNLRDAWRYLSDNAKRNIIDAARRKIEVQAVYAAIERREINKASPPF